MIVVPKEEQINMFVIRAEQTSMLPVHSAETFVSAKLHNNVMLENANQNPKNETEKGSCGNHPTVHVQQSNISAGDRKNTYHPEYARGQ